MNIGHYSSFTACRKVRLRMIIDYQSSESGESRALSALIVLLPKRDGQDLRQCQLHGVVADHR